MAQVTIYTTNYCGYCAAAKQYLRKKGVSFEEVDVTESPERRQWLIDTTGRRTVPQIFLGERSIGGYDDLVKLGKSGQLEDTVEFSRS